MIPRQIFLRWKDRNILKSSSDLLARWENRHANK